MKVLHDVKDIFVEAFDIKIIDKQALIISQLVNIVEQINSRDIEVNGKFMAWLANKFKK